MAMQLQLLLPHLHVFCSIIILASDLKTSLFRTTVVPKEQLFCVKGEIQGLPAINKSSV